LGFQAGLGLLPSKIASKMAQAMHGNFPALADLKAGNNPAWALAFSYLWPVALRVAHESRAQLTLPEAEEAASDAILCAIKQIERMQTEAELRALVVVIARRRAITMLRGKFAAKRMPGGGWVQSSEVQTSEVPAVGESRDPCGEIMEAEMVLLLHKALNELDRQSRRLLLEKYVDGFSYEELSKKHKLPIGTICPKVMRALQKVRRTLAQSPELMKELNAFLR
jgi:RNA polymerase sigma factor (sigma-70 family)